jgi:hypothetical protein
MSNIQYATRRFTIPAGEVLTTIRDSNFVTCLDAGGPFRVRFDDGPESDFQAGLTYSPDGGFSRLSMRNTGASAIDVFLGFGKGNINDARVTISSGQVLQVSANSPDTFEAGAAVSCDDGSTTALVAADTTRRTAMILNDGDGRVYISGNPAAVAGEGLPLNPAATASLDTAGALYARNDSGAAVPVHVAAIKEA